MGAIARVLCYYAVLVPELWGIHDHPLCFAGWALLEGRQRVTDTIVHDMHLVRENKTYVPTRISPSSVCPCSSLTIPRPNHSRRGADQEPKTTRMSRMAVTLSSEW